MELGAKFIVKQSDYTNEEGGSLLRQINKKMEGEYLINDWLHEVNN